MNEIWIEKWRPSSLNDIVGQQNIISRLKSLVDSGTLPHCLFAGPAGVGKTSCALALARELFGQSWHANFLELNASDERGIDTIRDKVKEFARTAPLRGDFKLIYLDEADALTRDAQTALRRVMEDYADSCRFILACNWVSRIIVPIQSRCAVFKFQHLAKDDLISYLEKIVKKENIFPEENVLELVYDASHGDMRKAINILQMSVQDGKITRDVLNSITSLEPAAVKKLFKYALEKDFKKSRDQLVELLSKMSPDDLLLEMHAQVAEFDVPKEIKLALIERLAEAEFRITEGSNPRIQLEALIAWLIFTIS